MNLAMRLTLDGLIRALRLQAQRLAEDVEFPDAATLGGGVSAGDRPERSRAATRGNDDDIRRG
ncbi:hypothetical protein [Kumtagia ephedrae]|jgi:hypothetical protein|uniref:hypothetical protein n=1 Tax=Kumtagia ephedrae TaxID=2116701 RepID=UPI000D10DD0D|nr:hypothetical protein [Mesorhizobium ephedrae]